MCLICVEYFYQRMTRDELMKALPEMIMFAKNDEEKNHFRQLQTVQSPEELEELVKQQVKLNSKSMQK